MPNFVVCPPERPVAATIDEHGAMLAPFLLWLVIVAFLVVHQLARRTEAYWLRRQQWREVREALRIRTQDARPLWVRRHPFLSFLIPYPAFVFGFPFFVLFYESLVHDCPSAQDFGSGMSLGMVLSAIGPFEFLYEWFGPGRLHPETWPYHFLPFAAFFFARRLTSAKVFYVLFFLLALLSFGCGTWRLAENLY